MIRRRQLIPSARSRSSVLVVSAFVLIILLAPALVEAQPDSLESKQNPGDQYLVEFKGNGLPIDLAARIAALGGEVVNTMPELKVAIVGNLTDDAASALSLQSGVADVTRDEFVVPAAGTRSRQSQLPSIGPVPTSAVDPTSAVFFPLQWDKRVIEADRAWQAGYLGSPDVRVAIIDSGVDPTNPDLAGLIDYSRSTSFCNSENALVQQEFPGYPAWTDIYGHGTGVASIVSSNGTNTAGITSRTSIMAIKALSLLPCRSSAVFSAIYYAANQGADVINLSLGAAFPWKKSSAKGFSHYYHLAAQYATVKGVSAVVVAAGNDSLDLDHNQNEFLFLCDTPGVICVSATGPPDGGPQNLGPFLNIDSPAFYTNFGSSAIDVAAPGGNAVLDPSGTSLLTVSWIWEACSRTTRTFDPNGNIVPVDYCGPFPVWGTIGTSESAPQAAGLAALLVSKFGHGKSAQVKAAIENSADDLGKPGVDPFYGKGRINVARALGLP